MFHLLLDKERPLLRLRSLQLGGVKLNAPFFFHSRDFDMSQLEKVFQVTLTMTLLDSRVPAGCDSVTVCQPEQYQ